MNFGRRGGVKEGENNQPHYTMKTLCAFLAILGLLVAIPSTASARDHHRGYYHGGYGHYHGGVRLGVGVYDPYYVAPYYADPYYVAPYYGPTVIYDSPGYYYWSGGHRYYRSGGGGRSHSSSHHHHR